ncbi:MAG: UvrD-helicase domain-containing protein [Acidobacteriota bacterium]
MRQAEEKKFLAELNEQQQRAVMYGEGPLLVLAGAGSGKTRVITYRIAHLVRFRGISPGEIVAQTFTNKAADEMKQRVEQIIGLKSCTGMWVGTFHAFCLRILRREATILGYRNNFLVYDSPDQLSLIKECCEELKVDDSEFTPKEALFRISNIKNRMINPEDFMRGRYGSHGHTRYHEPFTTSGYRDRLIGEIYSLYQKKLFENNSMDFDDMIMKTLELFSKHDDIRRKYAGKCRHLLVDEYQDTNHSQYLLIKHLSSMYKNICCVGDEDQSIYAFRGADINNILRFQSDFPGSAIIKLERNYRSTKKILEAASYVVRNNLQRIGKTLWTKNETGEEITCFHAHNDIEEADSIAASILDLKKRIPLDSIAVLYRTNAQSRLIEESLRDFKIPYQIVGSIQFYERKEIKDLIAYMRILVNPDDNLSLVRIINVPPRGIGKATLEKLFSLAETRKISLMEAVRKHSEEAESEKKQVELAKKGKNSLRAFLEILEDTRKLSEKEKASFLLKKLIKILDYRSYIKRSFPEDHESRLENIDSFISAAVEYEESAENPTLQGFIDRSSLRSDQDDLQAEKLVTLMTVHCAKGLEYPVVFIAGLEENLFPHARSMNSRDDIEEERRLFYVAMTRAKEKLFISFADSRRIGGEFVFNQPSKFISEIPQGLLTITEGQYRRSKRGFDDSYASSSAARAAKLDKARFGRESGFPRKKTMKKAAGNSPYYEGQVVQHPTFGKGTVLSCEGSGNNLKLNIHFRHSGTRKILVKYTTLTPIPR